MMKTLFKTLAIVAVLSLAAGCASRPPAEGAAPVAQPTAGKGLAVTPELYARPDQYPGAAGTETYATGSGPGGGAGRIVYFDFDSSEIRPDARPVVEANARYLAANSAVAITLEGHTDERGTREYNIGLGERRAEAVRRAMGAYGVASGQMRTLSYGEERPADPSHTEESYAKNRRVEIVY